ncbi:AAA family ATPase [Alkalinema sp. FACHB-956]|uniref:AAA family ATPase n=1 Tax=Alkalinema sp. FACHB-956 TaxID=2692768 RepID=UPI0016841536|nr:AAA family ATPase [Alkalinema sp. FACHB-956]MBD2329062.1 AAA family ATPase [Alkalinema sp. FACHB-956]
MNEALLETYQKAYRALDLFPLVKSEDIEKYRIDYGREVLVRVKSEINASMKDGKVIFTGHRGCGKSTLLKRLGIEMQGQHFVVFFSISDLVEPSAVSPINILYSIGLRLLSAATTANVPVPEDIKEELLGWLTKTQKQKTETVVKSEMGFGLDKLLQLATLKLQQEKAFRDEVETVFAKRVSDLVQRLDRLAAGIQTTIKKPVLVIIDDLDKLELGMAEALYSKNVKSLFSPKFRIVYTVPIAAIQEPKVMGALNSEGVVRPYLFPIAKFFPKDQTRNPQAKPLEKPFQAFLQILQKRIPEALIEPETACKMVLMSGGVMRELVRIARECCTEAMFQLEIDPDRTEVKIDDAVLQVALRNLRLDFARQITPDLYGVLVRVYQTQKQEDAADGGFVKLLHGLMVLEYENDRLWYDVHPIVVDLLRQEGLIE